ncbi:MAG TPA: DHA2 family efflux MFS transporter permease subunit, partial [Acidimicrobiales bacterium]|nr:DHA2 family efflux MFS transporter permease subunit [Acidimicrobiales bacterium]
VADLFGRRRVFLFGLGLFTVASLVGGTAQDQGMLLGARALQGLGAAVLAPATLTILMTSFSEGSARARAFGVWSAVASAGASAGALLGGVLTDALSWRWILFVNVPIGLIALPLSRRFLPESKADAAHRHLDLLGALTVTGGLVALVYAIVSSQGHSWLSARVTVPLVIAVVLLAGFLVVQARVARVPLVPLRIFRSRSVAGGNIVMLLLFCAMFGSWYFETLYMQRVLDYSPLQAGLAFLPQTVLIAVGAQVTARLVTRTGPRRLILVGTVISAAGLAWLSGISPDSSYLRDLFGPFLLIGLGMGLFVTPVTVAGTTGVPRGDAGLASGLLNTSRTVGASIGLAALATVAANHTSSVLMQLAPGRARTAIAVTDGYSLAILAGSIILLVAGAVAMATLPSLVGPRQSTAETPAGNSAREVIDLNERDEAPEPA